MVQQLKARAGADRGKQPNVLLPCGNFPDKWTVASAASLLKVNDPYNTGNYRSISIADSVTNFQCETTEKVEQQQQQQQGEGQGFGIPLPAPACRNQLLLLNSVPASSYLGISQSSFDPKAELTSPALLARAQHLAVV